MSRYYFNNKVALVTGGASGIGLASCWELAKQGVRIAMLDMDEKALKVQQQDFLDHGYKILAMECDVTREEACQSAINHVLKEFGQIDILFNNAGITQRGLFEKTDTFVFRKVMDVNFTGPCIVPKRHFQALSRQKG
ncbi:MAG: SDR family NAD(P)-dependent oxidoreductase [Desulfobacula sp.]|nr:SDR family NAD(P)-dependent oxidoreductase [Desulfobacula sp.]MCD4720681.1 SDR family NAD(P)-dependent oxidoreductase [Desulfobacula sp.]